MRLLYIIAVSVMTLVSLGGIAGTMDNTNLQSGNWLQYRGDRALVGHSPLKGSITDPKIAWKHFVGTRETLIELRASGKSSKLEIPDLDKSPDSYQKVVEKWDDSLRQTDPDGDLRIKPIVFNPTFKYKFGHFLPNNKNPQRIEFESLFHNSVYKTSEPILNYGHLSEFRDGKWQEVWRTEPMPLLAIPVPIVGDFDGDGKQEVAALAWYNLWIFDIETGKTKYKCRFSPENSASGRAYGWFEAADLNNDGKTEFVILADFESQVGVIGFKDGRLVQLWKDLLEKGCVGKQSAVHENMETVGDVDGDGMKEVTFCGYNLSGDDKWHIMSYNGMTGELKLDISDRMLIGLLDVDGDGTKELLCIDARNRIVPTNSRVSVIKVENGKAKEIWSENNCNFSRVYPANMPLNRNVWMREEKAASSTDSKGSRPVFCTRTISSGSRQIVNLKAWQMDSSGKIAAMWSFSAPNAEVVAVRSDSMLVKVKTPGGQASSASVTNASARILVSRKGGVIVTPAVVAKLKAGAAPTVVVQDACSNIVAFKPGSAKSLWSVPGRGICHGNQSVSGGTSYSGVVLADVLGNGDLATVMASSAPDTTARLLCLGPDGKEIWHTDLPNVPGSDPWTRENSGFISCWAAGRFTSKNHDDIAVTYSRTSAPHTEETCMLDGKTGKILWHRDKGSNADGHHQWGCGYGFFSLADYNGDGLDDIFLGWPNDILIMDGKTGATLNQISTMDEYGAKGIFHGLWAGGGTPIASDYFKNGRLEFLYAGTPNIMGMATADGKLLWQEGPFAGTPVPWAGIGDLDGDGKAEVAGPGFHVDVATKEQEFRCYDAATGKVKWTMPLPGRTFGNHMSDLSEDTATSSVTCDIDGDGKDECIFGNYKTLYAVSASDDGKTGKVKWMLEFPSKIGPVAIADLDGNRRPQIIVVCEDGFVYGIK